MTPEGLATLVMSLLAFFLALHAEVRATRLERRALDRELYKRVEWRVLEPVPTPLGWDLGLRHVGSGIAHRATVDLGDFTAVAVDRLVRGNPTTLAPGAELRVLVSITSPCDIPSSTRVTWCDERGNHREALLDTSLWPQSIAAQLRPPLEGPPAAP